MHPAGQAGQAVPYGLDVLRSSHRGLVITEALTASRRECIHAFRMAHPVRGTDKSVPYGPYALRSAHQGLDRSLAKAPYC